jgi:glycosyltransferase involved in cell wall biosynthesis
MMDENTITVGIPTYNRPDNLVTMIKCLQGQTYKNINIIVSDNASNESCGIENIVSEFINNDSRITYFKQDENIGAIRNMLSILECAKSNYFIWVADDDIFEDEFLEELHKALSSNSKASVAITGVDTVDISTKNAIKFDITKYLQQLSGNTIYDRLKNHIIQPAEWGKARLFWGLCKTEILKNAARDVMEQGELNGVDEIFSMQFPLDMQLLVYGDVTIVPKTLFHVHLLPSSNGLREGDMFAGKEIELCDLSYEAYRKVVRNTSLKDNEKKTLIKNINKQERKDLIKIIPFYFIKKYSPWMARVLKKIYFLIFVR